MGKRIKQKVSMHLLCVQNEEVSITFVRIICIKFGISSPLIIPILGQQKPYDMRDEYTEMVIKL
jgi:hypothetical protein